jgi:cytochrome c biogenesis protein CcdA
MGRLPPFSTDGPPGAGVMRLINRRAQLIERLSGVLMIVMGLIVFSNRMALINAYLYRFFNSLL